MKFNRNNLEHHERVRNLIYRACSEAGKKGVDWSDIVNRVGAMFDVNWLHVRYVLQDMRNERIIERDESDINREAYRLCTK